MRAIDNRPYEKVQKVNFESAQLYLEKQKSEISAEHYGLLSKEIENSRILIHDIKNHLRCIEKNVQGDSEDMSE